MIISPGTLSYCAVDSAIGEADIDLDFWNIYCGLKLYDKIHPSYVALRRDSWHAGVVNTLSTRAAIRVIWFRKYPVLTVRHIGDHKYRTLHIRNNRIHWRQRIINPRVTNRVGSRCRMLYLYRKINVGHFIFY